MRCVWRVWRVCVVYERIDISRGPKGDKSCIILNFKTSHHDFHHARHELLISLGFCTIVCHGMFFFRGFVTHTTKVQRSLAQRKIPAAKPCQQGGCWPMFWPLLAPVLDRRFYNIANGTPPHASIRSSRLPTRIQHSRQISYLRI